MLHFQDHTGFEIERTLVGQIFGHSSITVLENHMAVDFLTTGKLGYAMQDCCVGVYVLDEETGEVETLRSDINVLATGGCGKVYLYTANPDIATGDGVAMAWRAGAIIANMEFVQFHPTCLYHTEAKSFLISEAVRGEGGLLLDAKQRRFMEQYHPKMELAPRDIVARAIDAEMKRSGSRVRLSGHHGQAGAIRQVALPVNLQDLPELRHRYYLAADPCCSGRPLSVRRGQDRPEWRDQSSWTLRDRRGGQHGPSRSEPPGQQFPPGRTRSGSSRLREINAPSQEAASSLLCRSGVPVKCKTSMSSWSSIIVGTRFAG